MLRIICYDGVGVVGGNKIMLRDGDSALLLDFGKNFSAFCNYFDVFLQPRTNSALKDMLRLKLLPELPGIYRQDMLAIDGAFEAAKRIGVPETARRLWESDLESFETYQERYGRPAVDGVLLSHGHSDHFQHISFIHPDIPIYGSAVTKAILRVCQEIGQAGVESDVLKCPERCIGFTTDKSIFPGEPKIDRPDKSRQRRYEEITPYKTLSIGGFVVEAVPVDHSVPGACSFIINCPSGKTVFYTGDIRFHGRLYEISDALKRRVNKLKPDVVISEGTRINSSSKDDEAKVERDIADQVRQSSGLAIVAFGWKDITRFETVWAAAKAAGRVFVISPKIALLWEYLHRIDPDTYPDISNDETLRVYLKRSDSMLYSKNDYKSDKYLLGVETDWGNRSNDIKKALAEENEEYLEPRLRHYRNGIRAYDIAAEPEKYLLHIGYFDANELLDIEPPPGSMFIRASAEPFNAEMESDEKRLENWLRQFNLLEEKQKITHDHVSGHAGGEELRELITSIEPRRIIPVHTEHPEAFVEAFEKQSDVILPEKGKEICIT